MTKPNETYAYFTVTGDFDPVEVSRSAGVTPTECWLKGDINPRTNMERRFSRWSLYSRLEHSRELEAHVADVIDQLAERKDQFVDLSDRLGGQLQLVGYFHTNYPGFTLERRLVQSIAGYALSVDCDFYYLYSETREDS